MKGTVYMVSLKVTAKVCSRLGSVKDVEKRQKHEVQSLFIRVKVGLLIAKPIRRGAFLVGSNGKSKWVTFKYEHLPIYFHHSGLLGHDIKHCARHFA